MAITLWVPGIFGTLDILALILLGISFFLALKLKRLMGGGKDTGPVKLLMLTIGMNGILALYLLSGLYWKYKHQYINFVRFTDVSIFVIGLILVVSIYKLYKDFEKLVKKHEPGE